MPVITRAGLYGTLLGHPDQVLKDPAKFDAEDGRLSLGPIGDFLDRVYHNAFHKGAFADLHKKQEKPAKAGGFPTYLGTGIDDFTITRAYRMLFEDAQKAGFTVRELPLDDIRRRGYRFGLNYDVDELEYDNVIEIGSTLPIRRKFEVLAHGYAAKFKKVEGKEHVHYERNGTFDDDEFFKAGREVEETYVSRVIAALFNQN